MSAKDSCWAELVSARTVGLAERTTTRAPVVHLSGDDLARMIDHTLLKADATPDMIDDLCAEARAYGFASVCVNAGYVARCRRNLHGTDVEVCAVVGFPLGATSSSAKAFEAGQAIADGATEIDMVLNVGLLKGAVATGSGYASVREDVASVYRACAPHGAVLKVIIEAALLSQNEKVAACLLAIDAGADYVKTSTGFGPGGATVEDVALMRAVVGPAPGIKAAGGIRDYATALAMVQAGATRIGASSGMEIVAGAPS